MKKFLLKRRKFRNVEEIFSSLVVSSLLGFTACAAGTHRGRKNLKRKKGFYSGFYSVVSGGMERRASLETGAI